MAVKEPSLQHAAAPVVSEAISEARSECLPSSMVSLDTRLPVASCLRPANIRSLLEVRLLLGSTMMVMVRVSVLID